MTRPSGLLHRVRALQAEDRSRDESLPQWALRIESRHLISLAGFQYYADHHISPDMAALRRAAAAAADPKQVRLGTPFEESTLSAVEHTAEALIRHMPAEPWTLDDEDTAGVRLVTICSEDLLGRVDEESPFDLVCWNEANCLGEGVSTVYRAVSTIASMAYFDPPDRWGLAEPCVDLRRRYEDEPDRREALAAEIRRRLESFRATAPFPIVR